MKARGILVLLPLLAAGLATFPCGPFYTQALFQDPGILDVGREDLAKGRYGVLRAGLPWQDLILVYRALQGLPPVQAEPEGPPAVDARALWRTARAKVMGEAEGPALARESETAEYVTVIHIGDDALVQAARRLEALLASHGAQAARDWVQAQDLVFASVPAAPKIPTPVAAPPWLAQERDYQIAAARFYAGQWEQARQGFLGLAGARRPWGRYLAARCWFREGQSAKDPEAGACYRNAQALLEAMLKDPGCAPLHGGARDYLRTVRYRTEPAALLAELLEDQSRPGAAGNAEQQIRDALRRLGGLGPRRSAGAPCWPAPPGASDLALWLGAMAGNVPWEVDGAAALAQWRRRGGDAWMVAALSRAEPGGPDLEPLEAAARGLAPGSPLAPTVRWHLLRLELGGLDPQARARRLEQALREPGLPPWAVNQLRQSRQALARDLADWFAFSPREITATRREDLGPGIQLPEAGTPRETLDPAAARALSDQLPLAQALALLQAGRDSPRARAELAKAAWTKAVLLESWDQARALTPFLPEPFRPAAAKALAGTGREPLRFQAALCLMDWPGLRPALEAGFGRQMIWNVEKSGKDPLELSDALRDNWWCGGKATAPVSQGVPPGLILPGLCEAERRAARDEKARLDRVPAAQVWFGRGILPFARAHPDDERVPYALHRFIRTTRIPQCPAPAMTALGREAFRILHQRYPQNRWTGKTPYYF